MLRVVKNFHNLKFGIQLGIGLVKLDGKLCGGRNQSLVGNVKC